MADIARTKPEVYLDEFRAAVGATREGTTLERNYAQEIVANSKIAVMKLRVFKVAFIVSLLAFIAICLAAVAHLPGM